jgi:hypothetical protein
MHDWMLVDDDGIGRQRGKPMSDGEKRGHRGRDVLRIEGCDRLVDGPRNLAAARHAGPCRIDTVEEIAGRHVAGEVHERFDA